MDRLVGVTAVLGTAVLLLYYRVVGGWIGSSLWCVAVVCPRVRGLFLFILIFSRYNRPRAGVVQRTTSDDINTYTWYLVCGIRT